MTHHLSRRTFAAVAGSVLGAPFIRRTQAQARTVFVNSYGGVYAPQGSVNVSNNGSFATSFIVAGSASLSNNATVLVTST